MGTNYYFYPKGFDEIKNINKSTLNHLEEVKNDYINDISKIIEKSKEIYPMYNEMFNLDELTNKLNDTRIILQWDLDLPELHICKLSGGWIPLFNKTKYYSTFDELEDFYNKHKDIIELKDEYDVEISFEELKEKAYNKLTDKHSHLDITDLYYKDKYYKDNHGFEWSTIDNWS